MKRLTIIGTTPHGDGVVLSDGKGAKFLVANDPRLAAVTGHDLSRQLEMALQTFSPREIQARVRGGDSAEVIAAETGWPLDKVLRYAEPLLAERAYIAEQAVSVEVRRSGGGATLLETAAAALGAEPETVDIAWDAYRREDGKWVVTATYRDQDGPSIAQWTYDHVGRNVHPLDDEARALMGARPVAVPDADLDIAEALDLVSGIQVVPDTVAELRPHLVAVPDAEPDAEPDLETLAPSSATHSQPTVTIPHPSSAEVPAADSPAADAPQTAAPKRTRAKAGAKKAATPAPAAPVEPAEPAKPRTRKGRASVPSWDEILFGATKHED